MSALRIYHYKIYHKREFYVAALNRYGIGKNNNKNMDYIGMYNQINSVDDLKRMHAHIRHTTDNKAKEKDNCRIASIIWEMKLRDIKLIPSDFSSAPLKFACDHTDSNSILMPLVSVKGIGGVAAENIAEAYKKYGDALKGLNREEMSVLVIEKDGKEKKAFDKKILDVFFGGIEDGKTEE